MGIQLYLRFPEGKAKALTLSYDDGVRQDKRLVEILRKYGLKGTFNLNSSLIGTGWGNIEDSTGRMSADEALATYTPDVCEIACHSATHPFLEKCDQETQFKEVALDRQNLEALFNRKVNGMAYPFGTYDDSVLDNLKKADIYYSRTTVSTYEFGMPQNWLEWHATCHHNYSGLFELADKFISSKPYPNPEIFYLWGHAYEFDDNSNWDRIEAFAEKLGNRNDIWYATNIEIYNAWLDFKNLKYSADGYLVYNPGKNDVWVAKPNGKTLIIRAGEVKNL